MTVTERVFRSGPVQSNPRPEFEIQQAPKSLGTISDTALVFVKEAPRDLNVKQTALTRPSVRKHARQNTRQLPVTAKPLVEWHAEARLWCVRVGATEALLGSTSQWNF